MQVKFLASAALFPILSLAQIQGVDQNLVSRISADAAAVTANPTWIAAVNAVASAAPSSVLAAAGNNPTILFNQIASATTPPTWFSNVPTSVVGPFASLVAPAIKANADFNAYISSAAAQPAGSSLLNAVYSAAPPIVQSSFANNKLGLAASVIASTATWASNIPLPVQTSLANVYNSALRIEASDLEIPRPASRTGTGASYTKPTSGAGAPWGTGSPSNSHPPLFPTGTGTGTLRPTTCPACNPVTITVTASAIPSAFSASLHSASSSVSTVSYPSSGFLPKPPTTAAASSLSLSALPSLTPPTTTTTTPPGTGGKTTASANVVPFTGGAAGRGRGKVGWVVVVVMVAAGVVGGWVVG